MQNLFWQEKKFMLKCSKTDVGHFGGWIVELLLWGILFIAIPFFWLSFRFRSPPVGRAGNVLNGATAREIRRALRQAQNT